jgi:hypothetical protein
MARCRRAEGRQAHPDGSVSGDPIEPAGDDVVREREGWRAPLKGQKRSLNAEDHVVRNGRGLKAVRHLKPAAGAEEEVVQHLQTDRLHARDAGLVVLAKNVDRKPAHVLHDVVLKRHIADRALGRRAVLIPDGELNPVARLAVGPAVLEDVVLDQYAPRVLQLEQVLHRARVPGLPRERLEEVITANGDVGWHEIRNLRIRTA